MSLLDNLAHLLQGHHQAQPQGKGLFSGAEDGAPVMTPHGIMPLSSNQPGQPWQNMPQPQPTRAPGYGGRGPAFSGQAAPAQPAFMGQLRVAPNQYGQQPHIPFGGMPRFDGVNEQTTIDPTNYGRMGFGANVSPDDLDMIPGLGYLQGRYTEQPHQRYNNY